MKVKVNKFHCPTIEQVKDRCNKILNGCKYEDTESINFYEKNGFYFQECWNLDQTLAALILPRLIHYKNIKTGVPGCLCFYDKYYNIIDEEKSKEGWNEILNLMIEAFYRIIFIDELCLDQKTRLNNEKRIKSGLSLFSKYFCCLWD